MHKEVLKFFERIGKRGGQARARKYPKRMLRKWGKMGGRPRKTRKSR